MTSETIRGRNQWKSYILGSAAVIINHLPLHCEKKIVLNLILVLNAKEALRNALTSLC